MRCLPCDDCFKNRFKAGARQHFENASLRGVRVTEAIRPECVYMVHGFGHTAKGLRSAYGRGASDAQLVTRYEVDPLMGGTGMNVNFVSIEREG